VVPLVSMIRFGVAADLDVPMRLVCSATNYDSTFYFDELGDLVEGHPWLEVTHSFTRAPTDPRATHHRRIDRAMVAEAMAGQFPRYAYICGPPTMVECVQGWLAELGVDPVRMRSEKYD
jgi:ferredoxin-NADP reductase